MSFLRALRAYIGLGPDDEIEDRYLTELNDRRRQLSLDEIHPDDVIGEHDVDDVVERPVIDADPFDPDVGGDHGRDVELVADDGRLVDDWGRSTDEPIADDVIDLVDDRDDRTTDPLADLDGFDPNDERDLAFIERMRRLGGGRPGRHDIEPDDAIESLVDEGGQTVKLRARARRSTATAESPAAPASAGAPETSTVELDGAVVRSLDMMRAKPRTLLPESFADAKVVADDFKRDIPVVLNLQTVERDLARRLIDFASGICYALDGSMEKIASQVFLLVPESVEVSEDDRRRIEERGYAR